MSNNDDFVEMSLDFSNFEINNLKKYWGDLSWWERDDSIDYIKGSLNPLLLTPRTTPEQKDRIDQINKICNELWTTNERPGNFRIKLGLLPDESWKPNFRICLSIIMTMPYEDLVNLAKYLGLHDEMISRKSPDELMGFFMAIGTGRSQVMFYALRNYVGRFAK